MDPSSILASLASTYPKQARQNLIHSLCLRFSNKPCRLTLHSDSPFQARFIRLNNSSIEVETQSSLRKFPTASISSFSVRVQSQKQKIDSDLATNPRSKRTLQKWNCDGPETSLEEEDRAWDQFETNRRLYGVNPKFDENQYTTKRVELNELSADQRSRAIIIEKEIVGKQNKDQDEGEEDEEKQFGAVLGTGRYVAKSPRSEEGKEKNVKPSEKTDSLDGVTSINKVEPKKTKEKSNRQDKSKVGTKKRGIQALNLDVDIQMKDEIIKQLLEYEKEKKNSSEPTVKVLQEVSKLSVNTVDSIDVRSEGTADPNNISVADMFFNAWHGLSKEEGLQSW
jgi:PAB1-binding protein PBP1